MFEGAESNPAFRCLKFSFFGKPCPDLRLAILDTALAEKYLIDQKYGSIWSPKTGKDQDCLFYMFSANLPKFFN